MVTDRLYNDPDLAQFYDVDNQWSDDFEFCRNLANGRASVLDLGCGTGLLATTLASGTGRQVVGVEPAKPMLEIAGRRTGAGRVRWVDADARTVRLNRSFDLVVMTGHTFQVFLTAADRFAVLQTIAIHLGAAGRFVFDSRNPAVEEWKEWNPTESLRRIEHPVLGRVRAWNDAVLDAATGVVTYGTYYEVADGRVYASRSKIAFPPREQIADAIDRAGLAVDRWLGDWSGSPFGPGAREIVAVGRLASPIVENVT
jgi:SAM-dependent methyltransferase